MSSTGSSHSTILHTGDGWWLDPGLARLAFGSRQQRRSSNNATAVAAHLAFLPAESLELDLSDPQQRAFGDYELLELIGQGGMGVVYRAYQASLDRVVAVKLLSAGPWASRDFIGRFQREAQSAARMQHPNIVAIHEIGAHEEMNFFSMRLVHGGSLASLIAQRGKLKPREAARLLRAIAEAVDYAHRLDVLHLDLKPGNVLLDENGDPQVADFGLAKRLDETLSADSTEVSGTPSYMAPEQALAKTQSLSPATDIYGLGAILYECLVARPPFACGSAQETLRQVVSDAPLAPRTIDRTIPADIEAICLKCLEKDPANRYRNARDLADDLSRFLEGREVSARPLHVGERLVHFARREPRLTTLVSLLFFSLVFGFGTTAVQWQRAERSSAASNTLLWESRRSEALQLEREGKGFEAFPRLLANISELESGGKAELASLDRRRLGMMLGQGAVPIDEMVLADATPLAVAVSDDGRVVAVALSDQSVRWFDSRNLAPLGRVSLRGRVSSNGLPGVPRLLRFADNRHLRVTFDWMSNITNPFDGDTWLIDLDKAAVLEPPSTFPDYADAIYSADGKFALLRGHDRRSQLWQVQPWRPVSRLSDASDQLTPWLLGPNARYAAFLDTALTSVSLYLPPAFDSPKKIAVPGRAGVSAWARSDDGRWLALGDFEGRVFVMDVASTQLRLMPTPRGREVTWVGFSEDDAWLAVGTRDGTAYAFDVASGNPLVAGQMQQDFPVTRVDISHRHRLLLVAGKSETAIWRLPQQGPGAAHAVRIGTSPRTNGAAEDYSAGWSLQSGLLASAGLDGRLQLWRLPLGPTPPALAARQVPENTWFDGHRLVDVAGERIRVVDTRGNRLTDWLALPQAPGFAELLGDGRTVALSVGPELWLLDASTLRLRHPPIALVASPERFVASGDGRWLALSFSRNGKAGFEESVQMFDLARGARVDGDAALMAPLRRLAFSRDGTQVLAVGPASGVTSVLARDGLKLVGEYPHDEFQPVVWADFSGDGKRVLLATSAADPRLGSDNVIGWDPQFDQVAWQREVGAAKPLGVIDTRAGPYLAGREHDLLQATAAAPRGIERIARSEATAILALDASGGLVAHAFRREVQLFDVASGTNIGPPLQSDSDSNDLIVQLAFSPDADLLLARTLQGHWRVWNIAPRRESVDALGANRALLKPAASGIGIVRVPTQAVRKQMRSSDAGPWPAAERRPRPDAVQIAGMTIPRRSPRAASNLLDLGPYYTSDPDLVRSQFYNIRTQMRPIPTGIQRVDGTDYDLRGLVQFGTYRPERRFVQPGYSRPDVACIPTAAVPTASLRMLLQVSTPFPVPRGTVMAEVTIHYMDGSSVIIPIRSEHEVPGFGGSDQDVPMALAIDSALTAVGLTDPGLSSPRLVNPFPDKALRCVDVRATQPVNPALLFAITQEPVVGPARTPIASPVISRPVLRNHGKAQKTGRAGVADAPTSFLHQ